MSNDQNSSEPRGFENVFVRCYLPKLFHLKEMNDKISTSKIRIAASRSLETTEVVVLSDDDFYWTTLVYSQLTSDQKQGIDANVKKFVEAISVKENLPYPTINWLSFIKISSNVKYNDVNVVFIRDIYNHKTLLQVSRKIEKNDFVVGYLNGKGLNKMQFGQSSIQRPNCLGNILQHCAFCDDVRNRPALLERHLRVHTGERPAKCPKCYKSFANSSTLKQHMNTHTGQKPYVCSICDQGFAANSNLAFHMEIHYPERKKHKCRICSKMFSTPSELQSHGYSHTKAYPYQCEKCHSSYAKYSNYIKHRRKCLERSLKMISPASKTEKNKSRAIELFGNSEKEEKTLIKGKPSIFHSIDAIVASPIVKSAQDSNRVLQSNSAFEMETLGESSELIMIDYNYFVQSAKLYVDFFTQNNVSENDRTPLMPFEINDY